MSFVQILWHKWRRDARHQGVLPFGGEKNALHRPLMNLKRLEIPFSWVWSPVIFQCLGGTRFFLRRGGKVAMYVASLDDFLGDSM